MRAIRWWLTALASLLLVAGSEAQAPVSEVAPTSTVVLPKDTLVVLELAQDVNSRTARADEPVEFVVSRPVKVGDVVVVETGSRAIGTVAHSATPNFKGDPGEITVKLTFLRARKSKVPIRGSKSDIGDYRALIRGTQAVIERGTPVNAWVDADTPVEVSPEAAALLAQSVASEGAVNKLRLVEGTPVQLVLTEPISSQTAKVGDPIKLQVLDAVRVADLVVIPAGAPASGGITDAKAAGMAWHKGQLSIRIDTVTLIDHNQLPVTLATNLRGRPTNAAADWANAIYVTQGMALFALPFAPLQHGNQAALRRGTVFEAITKGDVLLDAEKVATLQPKELPPAPGPASVTFYFPQFENAGSHEIRIGSTKLGNLKTGRKVSCRFAAGRYSLRLGKQAPAKLLDLQQGTEYYVRVGFPQPELLPGEMESGFTVVQHDVGLFETMDLQPAEWKSMPDTMNIKPVETGQSAAPDK